MATHSSHKKLTLRFYPYELQLKHTFTVASCSRSTTPGVQTEIEYDGLIGYGEASMPPYLGETTESVQRFLSQVDLSPYAHPSDLDAILDYVDRIMPGNTAAKASIDIAFHDLYGKIQGATWHSIWGLDKTKAPSTTYTIGIDTPDVMKQKTMEVAGQFNILKVKLGKENDKEMIEAIRSVTTLPLAVDANQGWKDKQQALEMIHWLKDQGVVMIEQPMPVAQLEDNAWLTAHSPLPTFADESVQRLHDIRKIEGAFSGINVKLMKCTGMREAHQMMLLARELGMKVMIGCMTETSCAVSAAAQLSPLVDFADLDGNLLISNDLFKGVQLSQGKLLLNDLPGIGIEKI